MPQAFRDRRPQCVDFKPLVKLLDANEWTAGRRLHRIGEKLDWPCVCGTQGGGVSRSTDDGEPWAGINNGLTATNVRALAISLAGDIVAGTFGDAFRSSDNGDSLRSITVWRFRL